MAETQQPPKQTTSKKKEYKLLSEAEYKALSDADKKKYIPYNPSTYDKAMGAIIAQANAQLEALQKLAPAFEKMKVVPNPLPGEQLEKMVQSVEQMQSLVDPIKKLASAPIIGQLAAPLVDLINSIFQVIGFILWLQFAITKGYDIFTDSIIETFEKIDWEGLEKSKEDIKNAKNKEKTASISGGIDWDLIPSKQVKAKCEEIKKSVDMCYESLQISDAASRVYKKVSEMAMTPYSWQAFKAQALSVLETLGVDFSSLDRPSEKDKEKFEKMFPDPSKTSDKLSKKINSFIQETQYISVKDNAEILKAKAEKEAQKKKKEETKKS